MRPVDKRFAGIARGVGTAKILGRVHNAQLKVADLYLPCSFTVMEVSSRGLVVSARFKRRHQGRDVDLLLGLDMLKAHQACIDLQKGVLRIQGREVSFLPEHELPEKARNLEAGVDADESLPSAQPVSTPTGSSGLRGGSSTPQNAGSGSRFPGGGHTLGAAPTGGTAASTSARYPESDIQALVGLGASREQATNLLEASGGNVDVAASMLFG